MDGGATGTCSEKAGNMRVSATFSGAVISDARLQDTDLRGADLRRAKGHDAKQIGSALTDTSTNLPPSA
ncbi:pentapeptide repeat-containing protein [Streptomyces sp. NPDC002668]|uniref:pentapeptide repeat-containing protein n=1 Tax=Streptomyces sp. NPDC002668 TaxID=3154422 RepID=UPI00331DDBFA